MHAAFTQKQGQDAAAKEDSLPSRFGAHVASLGGATLFAFHAIRLLASLVLVGLTVPTTILFRSREEHSWNIQDLDVLRDGFCVIFVSMLGLCDCALT